MIKKTKKSQIWISVIIYTLVALLALVLILNTGLPILTEMKDRSVFTKIKDVMLDLDRQITEIANQGEGSQAAVSFEIKDGEMKFQDNQLIWEIETDSKIISPRTSTRLGNLIISSNANVRTFELNDSYLMETAIKNDNFSVKINKKGTKESPVAYNTSQLIEYVSFNGNKMDGVFNFIINGNLSSINGTGYTELLPSGNNTNLGRSKVVAHMHSDFGSYDIEFVLESYADFLTVRIKNFRPR
jgi:hypothetical protein